MVVKAERSLGRQVDISKLVGLFQEQEGEVQQIIGKTGQGKTYEATRRALRFLRLGHVVYTTWLLDIPEHYDERESFGASLLKLILWRKQFYRYDYKKNWHYLDIDRPDLIEFLEKLTDCIVMLDEGQDIFDSYEGTGLRKSARKSITRTRHMRKTLIIISQRAQAVAVTARANVTFFYKCVKRRLLFWDYFKVYYTEDVDQSNFPIWEQWNTQGELVWHAPVYFSGFGRKDIYDSYNSWYLRAGIPKSQEFFFEAYNLTFFDRILAVLNSLKKRKVPHIDLTELAKKKYNIAPSTPPTPPYLSPLSPTQPVAKSRKLRVQ